MFRIVAAVSLLVLGTQITWGQTPIPYLENAKEYWQLFSRGNDDLNEFDEAGTSNFETAQIRVTLIGGGNDKNEINLWLLYHAQMSSENFSAIHKPSWRIVNAKRNLDDDPLEEESQLELNFGPGGRSIDSTLGGVIFVGTALNDGEYEGDIRIDSVPTNFIDVKIRHNIENIHWKMSVKDKKVVSLSYTLAETQRPNRRKPEEILQVIRSSDRPEILGKAFPTRVGKLKKSLGSLKR